MQALHERDGGTEHIEFSRQPTIAHMVFAALPAAVALQCLIVLVFNPIPLPLMALMLIVVGCCCALVVLVVDQILPVKVTMSGDGLQIGRTWGSAIYPWSTIDTVKVVGATGTLGDDPLIPSTQRIGLGIFFKIGGKERETEGNPDVVLYSGAPEDASQLMRMSDHMNGFLGRLGGPKPAARKFGAPRRRAELRPARA